MGIVLVVAYNTVSHDAWLAPLVREDSRRWK